MTKGLLSIEDLNTYIGDYHILQGVNLSMAEGCVAALLGRNGAGKTTTLRSIMGLGHSRGAINFGGRNIAGLSTAAIARLGIGYVPENLGLFTGLTVAENLRLAARSKQPSNERMDWIVALFPSLKRFWDTSAGHLSGGQKQMLSIAKALVEPKRLILIDEPTKGLAPAVVAELVGVIKHLIKQGTSILLVEQNFEFAASLADEVSVLELGKTSWQGRMDELAKNEALKTQLLGVSLI